MLTSATLSSAKVKVRISETEGKNSYCMYGNIHASTRILPFLAPANRSSFRPYIVTYDHAKSIEHSDYQAPIEGAFLHGPLDPLLKFSGLNGTYRDSFWADLSVMMIPDVPATDRSSFDQCLVIGPVVRPVPLASPRPPTTTCQ